MRPRWTRSVGGIRGLEGPRWLEPEGRFGLGLKLSALAVVLVVVLVVVPFGVLVAQVAGDGRLVRVDEAAAAELHDWARRSSEPVEVLRVLSHLGSPAVCHLLAALGAGFTWVRRRRRLAAYLAAVAIGASVVSTAVKLLVARARPTLAEPVATAHGFSFPSGHATISTAVYGSLFLVFVAAVRPRGRRWLLVGLVAFLAGVGFSRIALGVHYVTDVVGGHLLGLAWLAAATAAFSVWREELGRPPVRPLAGLEPEAADDLAP